MCAVCTQTANEKGSAAPIKAAWKSGAWGGRYFGPAVEAA